VRLTKNFILATFILTFLVIIAGGVVRTTQSGMGCPDWPKCFGLWIPPTNASELPPDFIKYLKAGDEVHTFNVYHTWIEYVNRLLGALLGLFAIVQVALIFKNRKSLQSAFKFALAFLFTVILTGLFGAIVVKLDLAHLSISVHLLFAMVLIQLQLALLLSINNKLFYISVEKKVQHITIALLCILFIQSILGTSVRMYVDDVSKMLQYEQRESWLAKMPIAFLIHRTFSWMVLLSTLFFVFYCKKNVELKNKIYFILAVVIASMITGIVLFYLDMPAVAQPLHLLLASLGITGCVNILLQTTTSKKRQ
jgi:heme a synthase